ncbi:MAG: thermonuclease family protein [Chitinophagales bacterium]|nr:thermonuclease family protein [Chitinophagales bacterium]
MHRTIQIFTLLLFFTAFLCSAETVKVKWVIDGDTFLTEDEKKVRMIGINATERDTWFYSEAKFALIDKIKNQTVNLYTDSKSPAIDKHGRLLRYVELNGVDINKEMIEEGWAYAFLRYPFDRKIEYKAAEVTAQKAQVGLWGSENNNNKSNKKKNSDLYIYFILSFILVIIALQLFSKIKR